MMENYEEAIINNKTLNDVNELHAIDTDKRDQLLNFSQFEENKQKFDFGAEIHKTRAMTEIETVNTTSLEAIITTVDMAKEMPLNVQELSINNTIEIEKNNKSYEDDDEDEDDGGNGGGGNGSASASGSASGGNGDGVGSSSPATDDDHGNENLQQIANLQGDEIDCAQATQDESDETCSNSSHFSDLSGLSEMSGRDWKPISARPINWVQKQIHSGANPRELLSQMLPSSAHQIAPGVNDMMLWRILASMLSEPPRRQKLRYINTFDDVLQLLMQSQNIIVLTGAGVSVSCGIPDFRSSDGIYSRLAKDFPDLPDPQAMFDINYFSRDPRPFYKFAREIYPGQFKPSPCHRFIKLLEQKQKLLRNYTQNIDTLEQVAGIRNVIECHGSFSTASCTKCKHKCDADDIRADIFSQRIPVCPCCQPNVQQSLDASEPVSELELKQLVENGIMKPDIVFFGEGLPEEFHTVMASDKDKCDLLIVMGSSLKVRPVALIPSSIPAHVPQILINREQLHHLEFDVELLGDSDVIINQLCHRLGDDWKEICYDEKVLTECKELLPVEESSTEESEEDVQQMQDTDTQSLKSNASTDTASRSAGAYVDSGFESSTSSGVVVRNIISSIEAEQEIEKIKADILELDDSLGLGKSDDLLTHDLLEEPMDAVDFVNPAFHPFVERLGQESAACTENYRHLSIDSSKDSGIQCDSSNSAIATSSTAALLPPITNYGDSGGTNNVTAGMYAPASVAQNCTSPTANNITPNSSNKTAVSSTECPLKRRQQKRQSTAERLPVDSYYCHESTASYVFPGAQVSWSTDSEEDEDDDEERAYNDDDAADGIVAPFSPLLTPSIEAEMVSEITTTTAAATSTASNAFVAYAKRRSIDDDDNIDELESVIVGSSIITTTNTPDEFYCSTTGYDDTKLNPQLLLGNIGNATVLCNPPPTKRRRDSSESPADLDRDTDTPSPAIADYIATAINSSSNLVAASNSVAAAAEALLLQQL